MVHSIKTQNIGSAVSVTNPIALRRAETTQSIGSSECNRVNP